MNKIALLNDKLKQNNLTLEFTAKQKSFLGKYAKYKQAEDILKIDVLELYGEGTPENPICVKLKLDNFTTNNFYGIVKFDLKSTLKDDAKIFMPGFMYNHNRGENGLYSSKALYPKLSKNRKTASYSDFWMVRSDRLSHPASFMYYDNFVVGISASPYHNYDGLKFDFFKGSSIKLSQYNGFLCSIKDKATVGYTLGYENSPKNYILTPKYDKSTKFKDNYIEIKAKQFMELDLYLYCYSAENELKISDAIQNIYYRYYQAPRKINSLEKSVEDIATAIFKDSYVEESKNYATTVKFKDNEIKKEATNISIAWTGGIEIATPLLMAGSRLKNEKICEQARNCIQNIVDNNFNTNSGLPYDAYNGSKWTTRGWWSHGLTTKGHSSYVVGQAIFYILKAYDFELELNNLLHQDWLDYCEKCLDTFAKTISTEGEFPYIFSEETIKGIEYDSFGGCWCLAGMAYFKNITKNSKYDTIIEKAEKFYFKHILKMECYGTPLDTFKAIDNEGVLAYIKAVKLLHKITNDDIYLKKLRMAFDYEFSYKFCYNSPIEYQPLKKLGWSSCGGSITSTCNPHIHPMSNNVIDEMLYYVNITKDEYVKNRLSDTLNWGMQSYNNFDNEQDFGLKGWMSERFCHSEGLLIEKYPNGEKSSLWFTFLPWGASNVLEGMSGDLWDKEENLNNKK